MNPAATCSAHAPDEDGLCLACDERIAERLRREAAELRLYLAAIPPSPRWRCGQYDHETLRADPVAFAALPLVGRQDMGGGMVLELRNCLGCKSTLAREVAGAKEAA